MEGNAGAGVVVQAFGTFGERCFQGQKSWLVLLNYIDALKKDNER